jgi:hypothetical protein
LDWSVSLAENPDPVAGNDATKILTQAWRNSDDHSMIFNNSHKLIRCMYALPVWHRAQWLFAGIKT